MDIALVVSFLHKQINTFTKSSQLKRNPGRKRTIAVAEGSKNAVFSFLSSPCSAHTDFYFSQQINDMDVGTRNVRTDRLGKEIIPTQRPLFIPRKEKYGTK